MVKVARVAMSVHIYLTRLIEDSVIPLEIGGPGGAIYLQYLVLCNTAWSIQKAMSTFKGLWAYSIYIKVVCIIITGGTHCAHMVASFLSLPVLYT